MGRKPYACCQISRDAMLMQCAWWPLDTGGAGFVSCHMFAMETFVSAYFASDSMIFCQQQHF